MSVFQNIRNWLWPSQNLAGYLVRDHRPGAWQANDELMVRDSTSYHAVYACMTRIASDIAKLPIGLVKKDPATGIWQDHESNSFSPVLRRPNKFSTPQAFFESWMLSLYSTGNCYVIKERDKRGIVIGLYVLDSSKVRPVTAADGSYAYEVDTSQINELAGIVGDTVLVPPEEMIHDRLAAPGSHPLLGVSPIAAAVSQISVAQEIQSSTLALHKNQSRPMGALTAAGAVSSETVEQLRAYWDSNFSGKNLGRVAILADGLTYQSFGIVSAQDGQVIEQLKWSAEVVCSVFAVPPHMVQLGDNSLKYDNVSALNQQYYNQTLMPRLESIEALLNHGLNLPNGVSVQFNVTALLRLDPAAMIAAQADAVGAGIITPNESRKALNYGPVDGGDTIYLQQQMWPIEKLASRRDLPSDNDNMEVNRYFRTLSKIKRIERDAA